MLSLRHRHKRKKWLRLVHHIDRGSVISHHQFPAVCTYLGERLAEKDLVALLDKVSDGKGVLEDITGGESLVCLSVSSVDEEIETAYHVEEWEVLLLLADIG